MTACTRYRNIQLLQSSTCIPTATLVNASLKSIMLNKCVQNRDIARQLLGVGAFTKLYQYDATQALYRVSMPLDDTT